MPPHLPCFHLPSPSPTLLSLIPPLLSPPLPSPSHPTPQLCISCDVDTLSYSGACLPGAYTLSYSLTTPDGTTTTATRRVVVYQSGTVNAAFILYPTMDSAAAADTVNQLKEPGSSTYLAAAGAIRTRLGPAAAALLDTDIDIIDARAVPPGVGAQKVWVNATAHVYYPTEVHRQVLAAGGALRKRRRLISRATVQVGTSLDDASEPYVIMGAATRHREVMHRVEGLLDSLNLLLQQQQVRCGGGGGMDGGRGCPMHGRSLASSGAPRRGRRLQQTTVGTIDGSLAAMGTAFNNALGGIATSQSDGAAVDVIGGYLAALGSSLVFLEDREAVLNSTVVGVDQLVTSSFGDGETQRDATRQAQIMNMYQVGVGG